MMSRFQRLASLNAKMLLALILLLGTFLRFWNLTTVGLEHDEVANWLIDRAILAGKHGIYFQEAYGHEAGFHYLQTLSVVLLGDNALALRLPAALLGVLLIAVNYAFVKLLYNRQIALIAALILAVTFFPIFYSRLALRAIMLPVFSGLSGYFFWKSYKVQVSSCRYALIAGVFAGLSTYTYMASRVIPIFFALFFSYLLIWQRNKSRRALYVLLPYTLISAPLFIYLAVNPSAEFRISEINYPLEQLRQLNVRPVLENAWHIFGVWGWHGDPLWRQNVAGEPIFTIRLAIVFYSGLLFMLWRRQIGDIFVLLWIATATIPSIVTVDAPSTIRMINMLPLFSVPIGVIGWEVWKWLSGRPMWRSMLSLLFMVAIIDNGVDHLWFTQQTWPEHEEVQFVWQQSLTSMASWLDQQPHLRDVTILGWTPDTMDAPTMALALKRDDLALRFAGRDGGVVEAVVIPAVDNSTILRPDVPKLSLHPALITLLPSDNRHDDFSQHTFSWVGEVSADASNFANQWQLLGNTRCEMAGNVCHFATLWQVVTTGSEAQSVFVHVVDEQGETVSQSDVQLNGRASWRVGDDVIVGHTVDLTNAAAIRMGIYHSEPPYLRLQTPTGADSEQLTVGGER